MTTELPIDAIKQLFVMTDCDCEEECYCDNNHSLIKLASDQLQALLDALKEAQEKADIRNGVIEAQLSAAERIAKDHLELNEPFPFIRACKAMLKGDVGLNAQKYVEERDKWDEFCIMHTKIGFIL